METPRRAPVTAAARFMKVRRPSKGAFAPEFFRSSGIVQSPPCATGSCMKRWAIRSCRPFPPRESNGFGDRNSEVPWTKPIPRGGPLGPRKRKRPFPVR